MCSFVVGPGEVCHHLHHHHHTSSRKTIWPRTSCQSVGEDNGPGAGARAAHPSGGEMLIEAVEPCKLGSERASVGVVQGTVQPL